jgi:hypothetical protein
VYYVTVVLEKQRCRTVVESSHERTEAREMSLKHSDYPTPIAFAERVLDILLNGDHLRRFELVKAPVDAGDNVCS